MGNNFFDQYTYLHFACGIIGYFWGLSVLNFLGIHTFFEIVENSKFGMDIINKFFVFWPGGKPKADSVGNIIGDTIGAILGWFSAYYLDKTGSNLNWYNIHIK